jgi:hypothetical protein
MLVVEVVVTVTLDLLKVLVDLVVAVHSKLVVQQTLVVAVVAVVDLEQRVVQE